MISSVDLLAVLVEDLADRRFGGRNTKGEAADELKNMGKLTDDDQEFIEMPQTIIDSLTQETKPRVDRGGLG